MPYWPDSYARDRDGVEYVHVQMLDQLNSEKFRDALPDRMSTVYKGLLDNHASSICTSATERSGSTWKVTPRCPSSCSTGLRIG